MSKHEKVKNRPPEEMVEPLPIFDSVSKTSMSNKELRLTFDQIRSELMNFSTRFDKRIEKLEAIPVRTKTDVYSENIVSEVRAMYLGSCACWIVLITLLDIKPKKPLEWILVGVPIVLFLTAMTNADKLTPEVEDEVFKLDFLSPGVWLGITALAWAFQQGNKFNSEKEYKTLRLLFTSITVLLLSFVDIWLPGKYLPVLKHSKSVFQTAGISLVILSIYRYYQVQTK